MLNMLQSLVVIVNVGVVPLSAGGLIWMTISERYTSRLNMAYLFTTETTTGTPFPLIMIRQIHLIKQLPWVSVKVRRESLESRYLFQTATVLRDFPKVLLVGTTEPIFCSSYENKLPRLSEILPTFVPSATSVHFAASQPPASSLSPHSLPGSDRTAFQERSFGSLRIGRDGRSRYLGPTAASQWLRDVSPVCPTSS